MVEYKPWSKSILSPIISKSNRELPILDIQLGGACNLNCIYCDTPKYGLACAIDLSSIERLIKDGNVEWVYVCGLGEPTATGNIRYLKQILEWCKQKNIGLSMFSNILNFDKQLFDRIEDGTLHVLFKLDTFDKERAKYLYRATDEKAKKMYENLGVLAGLNQVNGNLSNLGASIVPTSINQDELKRLVDFCMRNDIFPLIGQLENAGKGSKVFNELELDSEKLMSIRNYIKEQYGVDYEMPICPATISSIHITNNNRVVVDERTGLSCPWFWLDEPKLIELGDIRKMQYHEIVNSILDYRQQRFSDVVEMEKNISSHPFGGCGGDVKKLLKTYIDINRRQ